MSDPKYLGAASPRSLSMMKEYGRLTAGHPFRGPGQLRKEVRP
jgi:hypothetical protein